MLQERKVTLRSIFKSLQIEDLKQEILNVISLQYYTEDCCNIFHNDVTVFKYRLWNLMLEIKIIFWGLHI